MSERFTSEQSRDNTVDAVKDLVNVDKKGRAHVPTDSGKKSGNFMSDHELQMIEAHADQIHEGYGPRMSEDLLQAVGILTDPKDIRDSLEVNGFLDDEEAAEWSDEDISDLITNARNEIETYQNLSTTEAEPTDDATPYTPKHRAHRSESADTDSPIFEQMRNEAAAQTTGALENESLEEYEARQNGKHRLEVLPIDELEAIENGTRRRGTFDVLPTDEILAIENGTRNPRTLEAVSTDGLDEIADRTTQETDQRVETRSKWQRIREGVRNAISPTRIAAEINSLSFKSRERLSQTKHPKAIIAIGAVAAVGVTAYLAKYGFDNSFNEIGGNQSGDHGGNRTGDLSDLLGIDNFPEDVETETETDSEPTGPSSDGGGGGEGYPNAARRVDEGEGLFQTFQDMGIPKEKWHEVLDKSGPKLVRLGEAYRDSDPSIGGYGLNGDGRLSARALRIIADAAKNVK